MIYAQIHTFNENQTTLATRPDQPDETWIGFDVPDESWLYLDESNVINAKTQAEDDAEKLGKLKIEKNSEINAARLAANHTTFTHDGKLFACDALSRSDIDGINGRVGTRNALPDGWVGGWKAVDNSIYPMADVAAWNAFYDSMVAQGQLNFVHSQQLKAQLAAATTAEEIEAIQW